MILSDSPSLRILSAILVSDLLRVEIVFFILLLQVFTLLLHFYANRGIQGKIKLHLPKSIDQPPQNSDF